MDEIIEEFLKESKALLVEAEDFLEAAEDGLQAKKKLEDYGQRIDRIMGSAKSIAMDNGSKTLQSIGLISELGKVIGYKGSQVNEEALYKIVVAFLFDATDALNDLVDSMTNGDAETDTDYKTLLDRLRWICTKFDASLSGTLKTNTPEEEVKELLKRLGLR
jgi:hypothetical protein